MDLGRAGRLVRDLDALYVNFISGFELGLDTAQALRRGFPGRSTPTCTACFSGLPDGMRVLQPLPGGDDWFSCFDTVQVNEDEFGQLGPDPLAAAAHVLAAGCRALIVTLGVRGVAYFVATPGQPIRSARVALEPGDRAPVAGGDPTGCGDVFGAVTCAHLLRAPRSTRRSAQEATWRPAT